jgi:hypothetical protein
VLGLTNGGVTTGTTEDNLGVVIVDVEPTATFAPAAEPEALPELVETEDVWPVLCVLTLVTEMSVERFFIALSTRPPPTNSSTPSPATTHLYLLTIRRSQA